MAVGPNHLVWHCPGNAPALLCRHDGGQLLQVDGVHDAGPRRVHAHPVQGFRRPPQELVALGVTSNLNLQILRRRILLSVCLHRQRVVYRHIDGQARVQNHRVHPCFGERVAHGCDVHQRRRAGCVVHQDAARLKCNFRLTGAGVKPGKQGINSSGTLDSFSVAQHVFEQMAQDNRQTLEAGPKQCRQIHYAKLLFAELKGTGRYGIGVFHRVDFAY